MGTVYVLCPLMPNMAVLDRESAPMVALIDTDA